jgi:bacteriorhodopsin
MWHPTATAVNMKVLRYIDWTITVPLLVAEVILVSTLSPRLRSALTKIGVTAALSMIFVGFLGGVVIGGGRDFNALLAFGLVSGVFFLIIYAVLLFTIFRSLPKLSSRAGTWYIRALLLLMSTWFIYPIAYGIQGFASGGVWAMVVAICLCVADILAKVGFGLLLQRMIMQRQADEEEIDA